MNTIKNYNYTVRVHDGGCEGNYRDLTLEQAKSIYPILCEDYWRVTIFENESGEVVDHYENDFYVRKELSIDNFALVEILLLEDHEIDQYIKNFYRTTTKKQRERDYQRCVAQLNKLQLNRKEVK